MDHSLRIRLARLAFILAVLLAFVGVLAPIAHAGDYSVRLTSTTGSHWQTYGATPFIISDGRVASGKGTFSPGDYRSWRAQVVGSGARIVGGTIRVGVTTPNAHMRGRIVVGTGSAPIVVHEEYGTGAVERALPVGPYDWVQFDLSSTGSVTTTTPGQDHVDLQWVDLVLRDSVAPILDAVALPDPGRWYGSDACIPFSIRLADQGGGLLRSQVRRATDGAVVSSMGATMVESTKPGPSEQRLADCITPSERTHGDTTLIATAWDVSGASHELRFTVRADHRPPVISEGPAEGGRITTMHPAITFHVDDEGSGMATIATSIDGSPVATSGGSGTVVLADRALPPGAHVIAVAATDAAGNVTRAERHIVVVDDAPPKLALTSPGIRGAASTSIAASASDDMTGIDPASWSLLIDAAPTTFHADEVSLSATIGPLTSGTHRIDVAVSDRAGNRATTTSTYYVIPPDPVAAASMRSGIFLVDAPRSAMAFGRASTITLQVIRNGAPVARQRITARRNGAALASAMTDGDGVAHVHLTALEPGSYDAIVDGMGYEPARIPIRVAPRVVITASTTRPRIGERVRISGRIFPGLRGRIASVEARVGGVWFPIRRIARTSVVGRFSTTVAASTPGPIHVRVKLKPAGAWAGTVSNVRLLRVTR